MATKSDKGVLSANISNIAINSCINETRKAFNEDIETYRDERGRVRVNKMKAMGIRMTRDLQRNLDLMKEIEQDKIVPSSKSGDQTSLHKANAFSSNLPESSKETDQESLSVKGTLIEVSFEDDNEQQFVDSDDDVFANIVAGDPLVSEKQPAITLSDCEWEEGMPGETKGERPFAVHSTRDESEVEWEEGPSENPESSSARAAEYVEAVSKGELIEEADFQEAIRRSMHDMRCHKDIDASFAYEEVKDDRNMDIKTSSGSRLYSESVLPNKSSANADETNLNKANKSPNAQLEAITLKDPNLVEVQMETGVDMVNPTITTSDCEWVQGMRGETKGEIPFVVHSTSDESEVEWEEGTSDNPELSSAREFKNIEAVSKGVLVDEADFQEAIGRSMDDMSCQKDIDAPFSPQESDKNMDIETLSISRLSSEGTLPNEADNDSNLIEVQMGTSYQSDQKNHHELLMKAASDDRNFQGEIGHVDMAISTKDCEVEPNGTVKESKSSFEVVQKDTEERDSEFVFNDMSEEQVEITKASLEDEMTNLTKERTDLGDEQRRLERNAESVSGEMFAECQVSTRAR